MGPHHRQIAMQNTAVVALALLESVNAFQAPVVRSRPVQMFSEGDIGVLPPLGVYDPLGLIETRGRRSSRASGGCATTTPRPRPSSSLPRGCAAHERELKGCRARSAHTAPLW